MDYGRALDVSQQQTRKERNVRQGKSLQKTGKAAAEYIYSKIISA
jgi:hypothetical protein